MRLAFALLAATLAAHALSLKELCANSELDNVIAEPESRSGTIEIEYNSVMFIRGCFKISNAPRKGDTVDIRIKGDTVVLTSRSLVPRYTEDADDRLLPAWRVTRTFQTRKWPFKEMMNVPRVQPDVQTFKCPSGDTHVVCVDIRMPLDGYLQTPFDEHPDGLDLHLKVTNNPAVHLVRLTCT